MCGNIPSCFAPLDDRGDRTNQLYWLKNMHTSYIFLSSQTTKGRVFYSIDKWFETGADPRNIFHKEMLKVWTPCLSLFYCVFSCTIWRRVRTLASLRDSRNQRARGQKKTIGSHLNREVDYVIFSLSARPAKSPPDQFQDRIAKPAVKFQAAKKRSECHEAAERAKKSYESGSSSG